MYIRYLQMDGKQLSENENYEDKTEFVIFRRNPEKQVNSSLTVGMNTINISESVKILGVTLDNKLNMQKDFEHLIYLFIQHLLSALFTVKRALMRYEKYMKCIHKTF